MLEGLREADNGRLDPALPRDYPRRVLLAVVGQSPQILTETVYALAVSAQDASAFTPTQVQVITTEVGAQALQERLLKSPDSVWGQLLADYGLESIEFDLSSVFVVADPDGRPLRDVRSSADNASLADAITERVRLLTSDPDCALHVSLAGGRKTMGYYAGYALSLFGRSQDRLSHVLVAAEYETCPDFHYPTPQSRILPTRDGKSVVDAACATIELALIPFVRLRNLLPPALLETPSSFAAVVASARMPPSPPQLCLRVERCQAVADGIVIDLTPTQFALLAALAQRARSHRPALCAPPRDGHDPAWAAEVLADLSSAVGVMHVDSAVATSLSRDCSGSSVSPQLSRLRKRLREHLGPVRAALYFDDGGTHRNKRYSVPLDADAIEIVRADSSNNKNGISSTGLDCKLADMPEGARPEETRSGPK